VSGQIGQGLTSYLGIINGTLYRIDGAMDPSWKLLELVPLKIQSTPVDAHLATVLNGPPLSALAFPAEGEGSPRLTGKEAPVKKALVQKDESAVRLFAREGAEPLRAGHPDLWHLLVAGTCLAGGTFKSV
jgi:hypothetical protein